MYYILTLPRDEASEFELPRDEATKLKKLLSRQLPSKHHAAKTEEQCITERLGPDIRLL